MSAPVTIPARRGKAARVRAGSTVRVINTHGGQVVDTWAFSIENPDEFLSAEHTRAHLVKLIPGVGDQLLSNRRRPILTLTEDTSGGIHDLLMAACDPYRYELLGCEGYHENCKDNLRDGMAELGLVPPETPQPFNLFMNIPWTPDGVLSFEPAIAPPGSHVSLRAEMDLVIAFSSCPQDIVPINRHKPVEAHFTVDTPF